MKGIWARKRLSLPSVGPWKEIAAKIHTKSTTNSSTQQHVTKKEASIQRSTMKIHSTPTHRFAGLIVAKEEPRLGGSSNFRKACSLMNACVAGNTIQMAEFRLVYTGARRLSTRDSCIHTIAKPWKPTRVPKEWRNGLYKF
ncbi:hypothetical protein PRNP1_005318 [Phytophthora ramorum]